MRVNCYDKFFAEMAKIMNTQVKKVKQLDGRYRVVLANQKYATVYKGVHGALFIHDYRGAEDNTSCYNFDDFKTMKDLYERLITDYSEETIIGRVLADDKKAYQSLDVMQSMMCPADREGSCAGGKQWKQYCAVANPNWHHVSIATMADIELDMVDEKRKLYLSLYKKWQKARKNLKKCSCMSSYERCCRVFRRSLTLALGQKKISNSLVTYFDRQISMVNVECGFWSSRVEVAMGEHYSRKYNCATLRY